MGSRIVAAAALVLSGCGGRALYECPSSIFGAVEAEDQAACSDFSAHADLARSMLDGAGVVPMGAGHDFRRVGVVIEHGDSLGGGDKDTGLYDGVTETIYLVDGDNGSALLHEMIHHWQWAHFVLNTGDHPRWLEKGYDALDIAYSHAIPGGDPTHGSKPAP